ncbi:MAG: hypothetical protein NTNFB02_36410 [Nitrospira sp.]
MCISSLDLDGDETGALYLNGGDRQMRSSEVLEERLRAGSIADNGGAEGFAYR